MKASKEDALFLRAKRAHCVDAWCQTCARKDSGPVTTTVKDDMEIKARHFILEKDKRTSAIPQNGLQNVPQKNFFPSENARTL